MPQTGIQSECQTVTPLILQLSRNGKTHLDVPSAGGCGDTHACTRKFLLLLRHQFPAKSRSIVQGSSPERTLCMSCGKTIRYNAKCRHDYPTSPLGRSDDRLYHTQVRFFLPQLTSEGKSSAHAAQSSSFRTKPVTV